MKYYQVEFTEKRIALFTETTRDELSEYRSDYKVPILKDGDWLFGKFSIADAMFAPIVLRFSGYSIPLGDVEAAYAQTVLQHPDIILN